MSGPLFVNVAWAQTCPASTTVTGTIVNFVGELTDMGGDQTTAVWFEYGQTISYGQKTNENVLTQAQPYCVTASGLLPLTTYHYRAAARNNAGTVYGEDKTFTTNSSAAIDIKANGSDGPITIGYNTAANLSWNSSNINSCAASNAWSGNKNISGSESTGNLTFQKIYTITCSGPGGTVSDSVTVNVASQSQGNLAAQKTGANLSDGAGWAEQIFADPNEILSFSIQVSGSVAQVDNVTVRDVLPPQMKFKGNLKVDNNAVAGDIIAGLNIGSISPGQTKTITFEAELLGPDKFNFGENKIINSTVVAGVGASAFDTTQIIVTKAAVAGAVTDVSTGLTNNLFLDSFFLPLAISLLILWIIKSRIVRFEEWKDRRAKEYEKYRAEKMLGLKIAKIKAQEFFKKRIA